MIRLRFLSLLALCALSACRDAKLSTSLGELVVQPQAVDFGTAFVGHRDVTALELRNAGRQTLVVRLELAAPFDAPEQVTVMAGTTETVELGVTATAPGRVAGALFVRVGEGLQEFPVQAVAVDAPSCEARDCRTVVFNPTTGACEETVVEDGTGCGAGNQCLFDGVCRSGVCVGTARDCDDGNACTTDACSAATGCVHEAVTCPASRRDCESPVCVPATGCGFEPALDGTSCGPNDCSTARVCINAACVTRPAPEGSQCAPATACQGAGVCRQSACERPPAGTLQPAWRYTPAMGSSLVFLGHADDEGNLYLTENVTGSSNASGDRFDPGNGVAEAPPPQRPTYLLSLSPTGQVRFRVQVTEDCAACTSGFAFTIDPAMRHLFFNVKGRTQARSLVDGQLLWTVTPSTGIPVVEPRPDGTGSFMLSQPMLLGTNVVAVPVMEGISTHQSYVRLYARATGALVGSTQRNGHLYYPIVSGDGTLWLSSAACWAQIEEVERIGSTGARLNLRPEAVATIMTGTDDAYGIVGGRLYHVEPSMHVSDLTWLTGPIGSGLQLVGSREHFITWDQTSGAVRSYDLSNGTRSWESRSVNAEYPDFELLKGGGVAWTSVETDGGLLGAIDGRGQELFTCHVGALQNPTTVIKGRAFGLSNGDLVAYDVPGLDVASEGWVGRNGSLLRSRQAR
jgi:hypothetical protein